MSETKRTVNEGGLIIICPLLFFFFFYFRFINYNEKSFIIFLFLFREKRSKKTLLTRTWPFINPSPIRKDWTEKEADIVFYILALL